jgi:hypothetical protein
VNVTYSSITLKEIFAQTFAETIGPDPHIPDVLIVDLQIIIKTLVFTKKDFDVLLVTVWGIKPSIVLMKEILMLVTGIENTAMI